jgi:hypothetical protein
MTSKIAANIGKKWKVFQRLLLAAAAHKAFRPVFQYEIYVMNALNQIDLWIIPNPYRTSLHFRNSSRGVKLVILSI